MSKQRNAWQRQMISTLWREGWLLIELFAVWARTGWENVQLNHKPRLYTLALWITDFLVLVSAGSFYGKAHAEIPKPGRETNKWHELLIAHLPRSVSMMQPTISNKCHVDHGKDSSPNIPSLNLFACLVCIQNIQRLLVLSRKGHLKWRYARLRETFAHTTFSHLYSGYVSDTRDKKFKLYVFLHLFLPSLPHRKL